MYVLDNLLEGIYYVAVINAWLAAKFFYGALFVAQLMVAAVAYK